MVLACLLLLQECDFKYTKPSMTPVDVYETEPAGNIEAHKFRESSTTTSNWKVCGLAPSEVSIGATGARRNAVTANITHPMLLMPRDVDGSSQSSWRLTEASPGFTKTAQHGLDPNAQHPHTLPARDIDGSSQSSWRLTEASPGFTKTAQHGMSHNTIHPGALHFREFDDVHGDLDWKQSGPGTTQRYNASQDLLTLSPDRDLRRRSSIGASNLQPWKNDRVIAGKETHLYSTETLRTSSSAHSTSNKTEGVPLGETYVWKPTTAAQIQPDDKAIHNALDAYTIHPGELAPRELEVLLSDAEWSVGKPTTTTSQTDNSIEPNTQHPQLVNHRDYEHLSGDADWKQTRRSDQLTAKFDAGADPNTQHPSLVNPRHLGLLPPEADWQPTSQHVARTDVPLDVTPSHPLRKDFRNLESMNHAVDWKGTSDNAQTAHEVDATPSMAAQPSFREDTRFNGNDWQATTAQQVKYNDISNTLEPNAQHSSTCQFRDLDAMEAAVDWKQAANTNTTKGDNAVVSALSPNTQHPSLVATRDLETIPAETNWKQTGANAQTEQIKLDATPSLAAQPAFRKGPTLGAAEDWKTTTAEQITTKCMPASLTPNDQHPDGISFRDLEKLGSTDEWKRNGKDVQTTQIGLDLTPSIAVQLSFRGGLQLEPDADWQESAQHIQRNDITNTLEPNTTNPHGLAPRELDVLNASDDWSRGTHISAAADDNSVLSAHQPNEKHPNMLAPRHLKPLGSADDWKHNGKDVQTTQIGLDLTPSIAVQPSFRGGPELEPDADWQESAQHINGMTSSTPLSQTQPIHTVWPRVSWRT